MGIPILRVEVAFASDPEDVSPIWVDITGDVRQVDGVTMNRGRSDEFSHAEPGRLSLLLDNTSGAYTWGRVGSPYWPGVLPGRRIRVTVGQSWDEYDGPGGYDEGYYDGGIGTSRVRFDGYVDGWPVQWRAGVAERALVTITATDRMQRLTSLRALRAPLVETFNEPGTTGAPATFDWSEFDGDDVFPGSIAYLFPMQEDSTADVAGDVTGTVGGSYLEAVTGSTSADATIAFGQSGILPEGTMVAFTPAGSYRPQLTVDDPDFRLDGFGEWTLFFAFHLPATPTGTARLLRAANELYTGAPYPLLKVDATPTGLTATWSGYAGVTPVSVAITDPVSFADGKPHFVKLWHDRSSGIPGTFNMQVDNRGAWSDTAPDLAENHFMGLQLGNSLNTDPVSLAWVGWSPTVVTDDLAAMVLGLPERSDVRIRRYLRWVGIDDADMALEVGESDVGFIATTDVPALDAIAQVLDVEQGAFFASGSTMTFHARSHRTDRPVALTVTAEQVGVDLAVNVDTTSLVNDYTVSRTGGATYRAVNTASVAAYGTRTRSATLAAATDEGLQSAADWTVARYGTPEPRCPSVVLDLLTLPPDIVESALALEVGDRIAVVGLPYQAPGGSLSLFVEGIEDRVAVREWTLTLTTSPGGALPVTTFDNATTALLDDTAVFAY